MIKKSTFILIVSVLLILGIPSLSFASAASASTASNTNSNTLTAHVAKPVPLTKSQISSLIRAGHPAIPFLTPKGRTIGIESAASSSPMSSPASLAGVAVNMKFSGLNFGQTGGWTPPDGGIAVGPSDVIECVNVMCEIWTTSGIALQTFFPGGLWGLSPYPSSYIGDPMVMYDAVSGHFIMSIADWAATNSCATSCVFNANTNLVAVSQTSDPTGFWNAYLAPACTASACTTASEPFGDQPRLGMTAGVVTVTDNMYDLSTGAYLGTSLTVLNKAQMIAAASPNFNQFFLPCVSSTNCPASVQPAQSLTRTSTQFLVTGHNWANLPSTNVLDLYRITGTPGVTTVALHGPSHVTLPHSMSQPPPGDQPGAAGTLNTDDYRIQTVDFRSGLIWFTFNDACTPSGDTTVRPCAGFVEISVKSGLHVLQQFDIGISGAGTYYPSLGFMPKGIIIVFSTSSLTAYPGVMVSGQATTDALNSYRTPVQLVPGFSDENTGRFGDYNAAAVNPSSPSHVWVEGEYMGTVGTQFAGWATEIAQVAL
jgi:hypothetical protein